MLQRAKMDVEFEMANYSFDAKMMLIAIAL